MTISLLKYLFFFTTLFLLLSCNGQVKPKAASSVKLVTDTAKIVGGGCDGCELMYIGMPDKIDAIDTSAGWKESGQKLLVTGKVLQTDGRTPAVNVIIYYWQTDNNGFYSPKQGMNEKAKRHGHIRGWVKTDAGGNYSIYTIKPAPYPNETIPAHIHIAIKEPGISNEYYIDEFVFDDDKLLTSAKRKALENRGGSGILRLVNADGLLVAEHNIILGLNIPNYPVKQNTMLQSGLQIGEDNPSFIPCHAWGADKGSRACPVCKYGRYHGIIYFVGNHPDWGDIKKWLLFLEEQSTYRSKYLKAYFVYGNAINYNKDKRQKELEDIGKELNLQNIALTYVPSFADTESEVNLNKINDEADNTFIIFKNVKIVDKFINLKATKENFQLLSSVLDTTKGNYFQFNSVSHD
jgi:protocatechuate 3,4-dioxygenase, beta subunit